MKASTVAQCVRRACWTFIFVPKVGSNSKWPSLAKGKKSGVASASHLVAWIGGEEARG